MYFSWTFYWWQYFTTQGLSWYLNRGQTWQNSCSSFSEVVISCFAEVAYKDLLEEKMLECFFLLWIIVSVRDFSVAGGRVEKHAVHLTKRQGFLELGFKHHLVFLAVCKSRVSGGVKYRQWQETATLLHKVSLETWQPGGKAVFPHLLCSRCEWMEFVLSLGRLVADKLAILSPASGLVQCCLASCQLVWSAWCSAQDVRVKGWMWRETLLKLKSGSTGEGHFVTHGCCVWV